MKKITLFLALLIGLPLATYGCESSERMKKDLSSEFGGGLERTIKVININGDVVKEYHGKFDVSADDHRIKFIKDGKVILIYRSTTDIILIEEN